jgi:hypothetical protein
LKKGDYVAVEYNGDLFPGKIIELATNDEPGPLWTVCKNTIHFGDGQKRKMSYCTDGMT